MYLYFFRLWPYLLVFILLAVWLYGRRRGWLFGPKAVTDLNFLPVFATQPEKTARITETIMLVLMALVMFAICTFNPRVEGLVFKLGNYYPQLATAYWILVCVSVVVLFIAIYIASRGCFKIATLLATLVVVCYGTFVENPSLFAKQVLPTSSSSVTATYKFDIDGYKNLKTDLWINDVYLGKAPITMTVDEFSEKVPEWNLSREELKDKYPQIPYIPYSLYHQGERMENTWRSFSLPKFENRNGRTQRVRGTQRKSVYHMRAKLNGEWGYGYGYSGGGGDKDGAGGADSEAAQPAEKPVEKGPPFSSG